MTPRRTADVGTAARAGAYTGVGPVDIRSRMLQDDLLTFVDGRYPQVVADLERLAGGPYAAAVTAVAAAYDGTGLPPPAPLTPESLINPETGSLLAEANCLLDALERWGHDSWRIPLTDRLPGWLSEAALVALDRAARGDRAGLTGGWAFWNPLGFVEPPEVLPWNPLLESARGWRARMLERLDRHVSEVQHRADAAGLRRLRPRPAQTRHVEWLLRFQLGGEDFRGIAGSRKREAGNHEKVRAAVRGAAALLGLPLREVSRGGRPRRA